MSTLVLDGKFQIEEGLFTGHVLIPDLVYVGVKDKTGGKSAPVDGPHLILTCPVPKELCPSLDNIAWLMPNGETLKRIVVLLEFAPGVLTIPAEVTA